MIWTNAALTALALNLTVQPALAFDLSGTKQITLITRDGTALPIGTVAFTPKGDVSTFVVTIDTSRFKTFFLSMRDFKCLEGPDLQCYVPYPYTTPGTVTSHDLSWLEHSLLFFFKNPTAYGANLSDGLIYNLKMTDHGIEGPPEAIDLNAIAAPPANPAVPPYDQASRSEIEDGTRWISRLTITDPSSQKSE